MLLGVPLVAALLGPLLAVPLGARAPSGTTPLLPPGARFLLGTDVLGRDVLGLALTGGTSVVGLTLGALALAYLVGTPVGLLMAGTRRRRLELLALRTLDVLLVLPSLLILLVLAATGRRGIGWLLSAVALVALPSVVRLVRSAASAPNRRCALEAMTMAGEPWWRVHLLETGRAVVGPVLVDAGTRVVLVLSLLVSGCELLAVTPSQRRSRRVGRVGHLPQHPGAVLDPVRRVGRCSTNSPPRSTPSTGQPGGTRRPRPCAWPDSPSTACSPAASRTSSPGVNNSGWPWPRPWSPLPR